MASMNFGTLSLTGWHRSVRAASPNSLSDQSRRRAQNVFDSTLYALLGGCSSTSNDNFGIFYDVPLMGTQGHEWPMSYGDIRQAHREAIKANPSQPFCLVDTGDPLKVDYPAFLDAVYEQRNLIIESGAKAWGPRNDSGDLPYLMVMQRLMLLDHPLGEIPWFVKNQKFPMANDLTATKIYEIKAQAEDYNTILGLKDPDIVSYILFGIGTSGGTCSEDPSINGVFKLAEIDEFATIKLAHTEEGPIGSKTSIPKWNDSCWIYDDDGRLRDVLIHPHKGYTVKHGKIYKNGTLLEVVDARHPSDPTQRLEIPCYTAVPRQQLLFDSWNGTGFTDAWDNPTFDIVRRRVTSEVAGLPYQYTRPSAPAAVKVSLVPELYDLRMRMVKEGVIREDYLP